MSTAKFCGDCLKTCEDVAPNFGKNKPVCFAITTPPLTLPSSPSSFWRKRKWLSSPNHCTPLNWIMLDNITFDAHSLLLVCTKMHAARYEVVTKIFRTDAVKILKLTIRPIGRRHPRSSSLPRVDTGPTVSSIFGTLPGSPFLLVSSSLCDSACISSMLSNRRPFSFNFIFGNRKKSQGANSG